MKKFKIIFWVATTIIILMEGVMPLSTIIFSPEYVNAGTKPLGYPDYFAYSLIICKVLGVLAISYPKTPGKLKEWAYAGLTFNLIFAFISHACVDKNIVFEKVYNWNQPFYIDKQGNLYFNGKKFFYPDYKKQEDFRTVVIADSLSQKSEELEELNDSLRMKALATYELEILKPYGLKPCPYTIVNTAHCDVFTVIGQTLVVRQTDLFKSELDIPKTEIPKFDDDVLIGWRNGKLPSPDYLAYYELKKQRFKCDDMIMPKTVTLKGRQYFFAPGLGLYQILF